MNKQPQFKSLRHRTRVLHEGKPTWVNVHYYYNEHNEIQIEPGGTRDHMGNFVDLDLLEQARVKREIREQKGVAA